MYMGCDQIKPDFVAFEQQSHRPDCVSAQSDSTFVIRLFQNMIFKLASWCLGMFLLFTILACQLIYSQQYLLCVCLTSRQQLRSYGGMATA